MGKLKGITIFASGFALGGAVVVNMALRSGFIRETLIDAAKEKVVKYIDHIFYVENSQFCGTNKKLEDVVFKTKSAAHRVLLGLVNTIRTYRMATIADFYDLAGVTNASYDDTKYGWTDLSRATVKRTIGGYYIVLPRPRRL